MTSLADILAVRSAVVIAGVIGPAEVAAVRTRLDERGYTRYTLVDRGSYGFLTDPDEPALLARLCTLAAEHTGRTLAVVTARALRLDPGDYLLARHDPIVERGIEVVLDLSPAAVPGAEVHYRQHGQVLFQMRSEPGSAAIVPRTTTVSASHTYLSRLGSLSVVRFVVTLAEP